MRSSSPAHSAHITALPPSVSGMRIGLFGGSFNPPHLGHLLVAHQTLLRLNLDMMWWVVTPGSPLKDHDDLAPLDERVHKCRALIDHPRIHVTGFEAAHGLSYTYQSLKWLKQHLPARKFVWIMGADNLMQFHRWERWYDIAHMIPLAIYTRPGSAKAAHASVAANQLAYARFDELDASLLAYQQAPAWVFLRGLRSTLSSTYLRQGDKMTTKLKS